MVFPVWRLAGVAIGCVLTLIPAASASDFSRPWQRADRALVLDAYEYTEIDWSKLAADKRVAGFINKASDGLPPSYACSGGETELRLCKALWKRYAVARELYHTRRALAGALHLEWGAYHLARPGNPIDQANHFIDFAEPGPDDLIALDLEGDDPAQWMSFADAEIFVGHIHRRIGRYPLLYTNGSTAKKIAAQAHLYPTLARLKLWYARYQPEIAGHFPTGAWANYALWQFASNVNCGPRHCPVRIAGAGHDIDVNVAPMDAAALRKVWPFDGLIEGDALLAARVPLPMDPVRDAVTPVEIAWAPVIQATAAQALEHALTTAGDRYPDRNETSETTLAIADIDPIVTGSTDQDFQPVRRRFRR
ncbi:MAG: muramidase [Phyllobacteriaceae bacterium]|nr:muramidase [Phyllobacteriaceae bacterium]